MKYQKDSIGNRMKKFEAAFDFQIPPRMPILLRIDGRSFTSWCRGLAKPFDKNFMSAMDQVAICLCENIHGSQLSYQQSDEITIFIHTYKHHNIQPWVDNRLSKMLSLSAGLASAKMTELSSDLFGKTKLACFDSRVFIVPESDFCNAFLWRQQDATRNSISMVAQSMYSHKELHKKNSKQQQEMIFAKGLNWNDLPIPQKRGRCIVKENYQDEHGNNRSKWVIDDSVPIFSQDRNYIEKFLVTNKHSAQ